MRLRDPITGTIVHVGEQSVARLTAAGWEQVASGAATTSTQETSADTGSATKPRRRSTRR